MVPQIISAPLRSASHAIVEYAGAHRRIVGEGEDTGLSWQVAPVDVRPIYQYPDLPSHNLALATVLSVDGIPVHDEPITNAELTLLSLSGERTRVDLRVNTFLPESVIGFLDGLLAHLAALWPDASQPPTPEASQPADAPAMSYEAGIVADFNSTYPAMKASGEVGSVEGWLRSRNVGITERQFFAWRKRYS